MQTVIKWTGIALGLLMVGIVVLVLVFDWNWIKGYVAREASKALGRTVVIEGDLDVELSWSPLVRIDHIRIANASWSPEPYMLTLQRLVFRLDLRELLRGHLVLPTIELVEPVLRLETSEQGLPNWTFGHTRPSENSPTNLALPSIDQLHLREGRFTFVDYSSHTEITGTLAELRATTMHPEQRLKVEGVGQLSTMPLQFTLYCGTLQDLSANQAISRAGAACHASLAGRPARHHGPTIAAAGRGGGGVPDTVGSRPAVRPLRAGSAEPGAISACGSSDPGRRRLGSAGAYRDPGDKRSEG